MERPPLRAWWQHSPAQCESPIGSRHPIPIFSVPGNHDYNDSASLELEYRAISEVITNWSINGGGTSNSAPA